MCGIAGFYTKNNTFTANNLASMASTIAHRGPNNTAYYCNNTVGLAHLRLSILDLSQQGNQPMWSACKRYVIVYNGEVYNYKAIAQQLTTTLGHNFKPTTTTDTEIILEAIVNFGFDVVKTFNGMFAFAMYDTVLDTLHIYRDKMGIKPLYYYYNGNEFAFASELKALLALPQIPTTINNAAIAQFLNLGFVPAPHSIYNTIYKLEAGHSISINAQGLTIKEFANVDALIQTQPITNATEAKHTLNNLLTNAVQLQLQSDVPCGVFLSGGTDSSLLAAIAQQQRTSAVQSFSIGFNETKYNEANHAKQVAAHIGTQHNELIVSQKDALPIIQQLQSLYDEPYADTSAVPTFIVAAFAKNQVTVALSGEGADELFHGYGAYKWAKRMQNPILKNTKKIVATALKIGNSRYKRVARLLDFETQHNNNLQQHIYSQEQYNFSEKEIKNLLITHTSVLLPTNANVLLRTLTPSETQALYDIKVPLQDDLLTKVDRATMYHGLEARVPFLDNNVVEFAMNLSPQLKIKNGVQKHLLKQVLYNYVPQNIMERTKQGFAIPLQQWLKQDLYFMINDYLSPAAIHKTGILNNIQVQQIINAFMQKDYTLYRRVWLMIVLQKWMLEIKK
jgi:asparagine synthase (glutamine-hydrolysing)